MAKKHYRIASEQGAEWARVHEPRAAVDDVLALELSGADQERALVAAGWLEPTKAAVTKYDEPEAEPEPAAEAEPEPAPEAAPEPEGSET